MTKFPFPLLRKIRTALEAAEDAMWEIALERGYPDAARKTREGRYLNPEAAMQSNLERAFGDLRILAETLGQRDCVGRIKLYEEKSHGKFASVRFDNESDDTYSPTLDQAKSYLDSLLAASDFRATEDPQPFENILRNTAKIILRAGVSPSKETDVKDTVFEVLQTAYPDAVRKQAIAHPVKSYVPDFASKAAQAVAEYKFARNVGELKTACDHLAKSMLGYSGDDTWAEKFGVIYLTSPFASQLDVDAQCKSIGMPEDWRIIVLNGKGIHRRKKPRQSRTKSASRSKKKR